MKPACVAAALSFAALSALAAAPSGKPPVSFSHNDWELACDNTRTCRAAGYQQDGEPVSMRITRKAGPGTTVDIDLQTGGEEEAKGPLRLKVGKATVTGLQGGSPSLDASQVRAVLPELLKSDDATLTAGGGKQWVLSLSGLNAVLLKMDEAQGRVDTPGALVRRGGKPESSVLAALPMPVVNALEPVKARPGDDALAARIFPSLKLSEADGPCNSMDAVQPKSLQVHRLTDSKVLLSLECSVGAYNSTSQLWIANDKPPYAPSALEANGDFDDKDASVSSVMKVRGIGDCVSTETWHFDGTGFARTGATVDGLCRDFPGGAWNLPRYVSRVVPAPVASPSKP